MCRWGNQDMAMGWRIAIAIAIAITISTAMSLVTHRGKGNGKKNMICCLHMSAVIAIALK